ncbi:olfactory receptor 7G2-like [Nannospalax galili]|uniref:olfactory receptor 7G2-like n=1 Tax=Nannospalax galili TaxID=1026970 RepID=UPI0004ED059B|nr:olfactory receptor 7G2-like [Nannospalax galili]
MGSTNQTATGEFLLLGLSDDTELQSVIFALFLFIYLATVLGNLIIILAIISDSHLHTPMYFFISNLSFADICISTTTIPKMLVNIRTQDQRITHTGCFTQACFAMVFASLESCLLSAMAYDRYVAICHPLRYTVTMNFHSCSLLILFSLFISSVNVLLLSLTVLQLSFCRDLEIPHFFCELTQLVNLACSDTFISNMLIYIASIIFGGIPVFGIIFSYVEIISSVLKISSVQGRYKAFSTCVSHLSVVSLFYGTGLSVCIGSAVNDSPRKTAVASVMYSVVTQMLNPFIYSLRNRDMAGALRKLMGKMASFI